MTEIKTFDGEVGFRFDDLGKPARLWSRARRMIDGPGRRETAGGHIRLALVVSSIDDKIKALEIWEQDARQMLTASGEGMPGSEEGINPSNHNMLGQVGRARDKLQRSPIRAAPRRSE